MASGTILVTSRERPGSSEDLTRKVVGLVEALATGEGRTTVPATEEELARVERAIGDPLPPELRALLVRGGAGIYDNVHEVFGPTRVMIHDIELVPDMLSVLGRLAVTGAALEPHLVPFHRAHGVVHLVRTAGVSTGEIVALPTGATYPDLAAFLEQVLAAPPRT